MFCLCLFYTFNCFDLRWIIFTHKRNKILIYEFLQVSAKRKLHSLVGRWQEAVHISENDKMKSDKMIKKREFKVLRNAFDTWKDMNAKFMAANELSDILLLKR